MKIVWNSSLCSTYYIVKQYHYILNTPTRVINNIINYKASFGEIINERVFDRQRRYTLILIDVEKKIQNEFFVWKREETWEQHLFFYPSKLHRSFGSNLLSQSNAWMSIKTDATATCRNVIVPKCIYTYIYKPIYRRITMKI